MTARAMVHQFTLYEMSSMTVLETVIKINEKSGGEGELPLHPTGFYPCDVKQLRVNGQVLDDEQEMKKKKKKKKLRKWKGGEGETSIASIDEAISDQLTCESTGNPIAGKSLASIRSAKWDESSSDLGLERTKPFSCSPNRMRNPWKKGGIGRESCRGSSGGGGENIVFINERGMTICNQVKMTKMKKERKTQGLILI